jgi:hypothetical protein
MDDEPGASTAATPYVGAGSNHELAGLIAMELQRDIDARIDWSLQQRQPARHSINGMELGLILGSVGIAVPLTAIAGSAAGLPGILIVWLGLVLINVAWSIRR